MRHVNRDYQDEHEKTKQIHRQRFLDACLKLKIIYAFTLANPDGRDIRFYQENGLRVIGWELKYGDIRKVMAAFQCYDAFFLDLEGAWQTYAETIKMVSQWPNVKVLMVTTTHCRGFEHAPTELEGFKLTYREDYGNQMQVSRFERIVGITTSTLRERRSGIPRGQYLDRLKEHFALSAGFTVQEVKQKLGGTPSNNLPSYFDRGILSKSGDGTRSNPYIYKFIGDSPMIEEREV